MSASQLTCSTHGTDSPQLMDCDQLKALWSVRKYVAAIQNELEGNQAVDPASIIRLDSGYASDLDLVQWVMDHAECVVLLDGDEKMVL